MSVARDAAFGIHLGGSGVPQRDGQPALGRERPCLSLMFCGRRKRTHLPSPLFETVTAVFSAVRLFLARRERSAFKSGDATRGVENRRG